MALILGFVVLNITFSCWLNKGTTWFESSASAYLIWRSIMDLNLLIVRQRVNLLNSKEILFVLCEFHIIVTGVMTTWITLSNYFFDLVRIFGSVTVRLIVCDLRIRLQDLLNNFSNLMFGLDGFSSLLLYTVNTASFLIKLNQCFSGWIFDLKRFGSLSNGDSVLLSEFDQHSPRLSWDRVVMVPLLSICFMLWNFGEHFTRLDYIGFLILNYLYTIRIEI